MQSSTQSLDTQCRSDFPVFERRGRDDKALVYLDNAATTQKPIQVIDAITDYYKNHNSNIHRAVHALAEESTEAFEVTRSKIAKFLNVSHSEEIIFVRGTTEAINLVAYAWGRDNVQKGDIVVTTEYEHHSNIVPWQVLTQETGAELRYVDIDNNGELMLEQLDDHLATGKVKLVAVSHVSNVLGTITDIQKVIKKCKDAGAKILVDGAQAVPHMKVDIGRVYFWPCSQTSRNVLEHERGTHIVRCSAQFGEIHHCCCHRLQPLVYTVAVAGFPFYVFSYSGPVETGI